MSSDRSSRVRFVARVVLGGALVLAGVGHLTFARTDFQAQVPDWVGIDKDVVVILSGLVEIALGLALIVVRRRRALLGLAAGLFFIAVFPGNVSTWTATTPSACRPTPIAATVSSSSRCSWRGRGGPPVR